MSRGLRAIRVPASLALRHAWTLALTLTIVAVGSAAPAVMATDPVREWNLVAANTTLSASPALAPVQQVRAMAIAQVSVHDAVNAITGEFDTYQDPGAAPGGTSVEAAAIGAAHHALRTLFAAQASTLDGLFTASLAAHGVSSNDPGLAFGQSVAASLLALRATDGAASAQFPYTAPGAGSVGVWVPLGTQSALLPGWGAVRPFVLRSGDQFRPDPPPALDSEQYAKDYNEIVEIGRQVSATRTQTQTDIALFWRGSPTAIWNPVIHQALDATTSSLSEAARALALVYLAANESSIACWESKYVYNFWRPQPAIVAGDIDGNAATTGDSTWLPLLPTPPHPDYLSGHSTNSGAIGVMLGLIFGDNPGTPLTVTLTGITRQWETFSEAIDEVVDARVYSGIHFRTADEAGARVGRQVARFVYTHALKPSRGRR